MSTGHLLIAIGLGLDILATLFLSIDLLRSQCGLNQYFERQIFIERIALTTEDLKRSIARLPLPGGTPEQDELIEIERITLEGSLDAEIINRTNAVNELEALTKEFRHRIPLVKIAIVTVVLGGLLNLTSVIFFRG